MNWIKSGGGPLICAEDRVAAQWRGIDGVSVPSSPHATDYERAGGTEQYLQAMTCAAGRVLVLGDEPLQSCFFRTGDGDIALARWSYAPSAKAADEFLATFSTGIELAPAIPFDVTQGALVLFDSARSGALTALADYLKADVPPGRYRVTTEQWQMDRQLCFIVHRLKVER